jgi:hypothetical protein
MSDFLTRLAARTLGLGAAVAPDVPPDFDGVTFAPPAEADEIAGWTAAASTSVSHTEIRRLASADGGPAGLASTMAALSHADGRDAVSAPRTAPPFVPLVPTARTLSAAGPGEPAPIEQHRGADPSPPAAPSHPAIAATPAFVPPPQQRAATPHASRLAGAEVQESPQPAFVPLVRRAASAQFFRTTDEHPADDTAEAPGPALPRRPRSRARQDFLPFAEPARDVAAAPAESRSEPGEPTTVKVTIGRIEVRANPPRPAPRPAPRRRGISLDDYLRQRSGRP